jgi:hypothetical protein
MDWNVQVCVNKFIEPSQCEIILQLIGRRAPLWDLNVAAMRSLASGSSTIELLPKREVAMAMKRWRGNAWGLEEESGISFQGERG